MDRYDEMAADLCGENEIAAALRRVAAGAERHGAERERALAIRLADTTADRFADLALALVDKLNVEGACSARDVLRSFARELRSLPIIPDPGESK